MTRAVFRLPTDCNTKKSLLCKCWLYVVHVVHVNILENCGSNLYKAMSLHQTMLMGDGRDQRNTRQFVQDGRQQGANYCFTTSIPVESYATTMAEVTALKPKKRKHWKSTLTDARGQNTRVRYVEDGIKVPGRNFVSRFQNKLSGKSKHNMASMTNGGP